ncbi:hypothetical protein LSTR_LSTR013999 [Laodelphax striatellus]|uniref:Reverse transcriptase zinc-binding domain-containing protein n=1 Tax=Laodelphax striatellus TaxID=195883 RepID=A0A482WVT3_LAOST|nr:hypothetical protein LSTR_LSTR013999 [Laodelphax striatellus]
MYHSRIGNQICSTSPNSECGETQTMDHIVSSCPLYHFPGGLPRLHLADEEAVLWLEGLNGI